MRILSRFVAVAALVAALAVPAAAAAGTTGLRLGSLTLHGCDLGLTRATWCGTLAVPLDYTDAGAGTISVGFGWAPAANPIGTVLAQEGGPGYPSTGTAADFAQLLGRNRNLLVVDAVAPAAPRRSTASRCSRCPRRQRGSRRRSPRAVVG